MVVSKSVPRVLLLLLLVLCVPLLSTACKEDEAAVHLRGAVQDVHYLVARSAKDVEAVRTGLPAGAAKLSQLIEKRKFSLTASPEATLVALKAARGSARHLRIAKSTFFAIAKPDGQVIRDDRDRDRMAGKSLFASFPALKQALSQAYVETTGSMKEAARRSDSDGQWAAAVPVKVGGEVKAIYATGWAWSFYARTLQNNLRTKLRLAASEEKKRAPLIYVFILTKDGTFAWRETPIVDSEAVQNARPPSPEPDTWSKTLDITGRQFGLAVERAPALGAGVYIAIIRS